MSGVRLLVGTRKGAFVLTSDGTRDDWKVEGPLFTGWEMYHLNASPVDPDRLYASQSTGWHGQVVQRSDDGGKTWEPVGNEFKYDGVPGTHQWYDGTQHPWEFARVWHLEPSLTDADTVFAGVEDAALFRSTDAGQTWQELSGLRDHKTGEQWQPGAGGLCLHSIIIHPDDPQRMFVAISAAGCFRTDDGGETWQPINKGLRSRELPDEEREVGHCVHRIAMNPSRPDTLFMQKHWHVMRSDDGGDSWQKVSGNLPFGLRVPDRRASARAGDGLRRADRERLRARSAGRQAARLPQPDRRERVGGAHERAAAGELLPERAPRCDGGRHARSRRRLLRDERRAGLRVAGQRRQLDGDRARPAAGALGRGADAVVIRVVLPHHLRTLAGVEGEVSLDAQEQPTQRTVLDALEASYPTLRGTIRDHGTAKRRDFIRFFACGQDITLDPADDPLPDEVASGAQPFRVVGAMAGG